MRKTAVFLMLGLLLGVCQAELPGVRHWTLEENMETAYKNIYRSLEDSNLFVIFEPNIGKNLAGFSGLWGANYNRNHLQGIRSMVFCSAWYTNEISNIDPQLLALCPMHITFYRQDNITHIVFVRPVHVGQRSAAAGLLEGLEAKLSAAVEAGIAAAQR
ncbi:MAG: DUF302 domain-containing protein [Gammaproteobacteria bacterium]|nr:DUF302 domain-containing protein [Gammaproteobacteria bacterium]